MKKRGRKFKKDFLSASSVSLVVISMLMALYLISSNLQETKFAGFVAPPPPSECADGTAEVSLLNSQFINNAVIINVTSPSCAIAVANIHLDFPSGTIVDLDNIRGTGAFEDIIVEKKKQYTTKTGKINIEIPTFDFNYDLPPSNYEGSLIIPFSAAGPGDYEISVREKIRFFTDDNRTIKINFHIPKLILQMFNFSFYVQPSSPAPTISAASTSINKVPVGSLGDAVINTTIAGSFGFNMAVSDSRTTLNKQTTATTQSPIYIWKESFDSYLHPENKYTCNAGKVNATVILNYNNNLVTNNIEVELTIPELKDIYAVIDKYFNSIGTDSEDPTLIPRAYYMVGSYFNCP